MADPLPGVAPVPFAGEASPGQDAMVSLLVAAGFSAGAVRYGRPGPQEVLVEDGEWHDAERRRILRWRRYRPAGGPVPLVIHSHGLGGSRESGAEWLAHWASWGIAGLAVQHPGTDAGALASASPLALRHLLRTAVDSRQLADRQQDLLFALERAAGEDASVIGLSGHSFGAASVLRLIGERRGVDDRPADPHVAAAVLFSPSARGGSLPLTERFAGVTIPCLHLTGTCDDGIGPGDISARDRCLPYEHMRGADRRLLVIEGATHPEFAGEAGGRSSPTNRAILRAASTAFWCEHLFTANPATLQTVT